MSTIRLESVHLSKAVKLGPLEAIYFKDHNHKIVLRDHDMIIITDPNTHTSVHVPMANVLSYTCLKDEHGSRPSEAHPLRAAKKTPVIAKC